MTVWCCGKNKNGFGVMPGLTSWLLCLHIVGPLPWPLIFSVLSISSCTKWKGGNSLVGLLLNMMNYVT